MSINEEQRIIVDQNQIKIGINYLHQLILWLMIETSDHFSSIDF